MDFESLNKEAEYAIYKENFINFLGFSLLFLIFGLGMMTIGLLRADLSTNGFLSLGIICIIISGLCLLPAIYIKYRISKTKILVDTVYKNNLPYN